jgi:UDP:flavonoid glycosyltransferase YjiC (YdhE family)
VQSYLQPIHPTREFGSALMPTARPRGPVRNYLSHVLGGQLFWHIMRTASNEARREVLGTGDFPFFGPFLAIERAKVPALYAFSRHVIPKPRDWADHLHVTGYWFLDEGVGWAPPPALARFLAEGPPPVYVGFGSMASRDPAAMARLVLTALERSGERGVLLTGWQGLSAEAAPPEVLVIDSAPHDWLFPRMAAVVHHGGAGTTAAGLRAGVPSVLVPFFADQPFWAQRVVELGVGPPFAMREDVTVESLAAAIRTAVTDEGMRARAAALGAHIREERGVEEAVRQIEAEAVRRGAMQPRPVAGVE